MSDTLERSGVEARIRVGEQAQAQQAALKARMRTKKFDTIAVHGMYDMQAALANQGSIMEPVYLSSAQHFEDSDHLEAALAYLTPAWGYTRIANPSLYYLEQTLGLLESYGFEGEADAMVTSSGMAAVFMATQAFLSREHGHDMNFVASAKCYGGSFQLFTERYQKEQHIDVRWISNNLDINAWEAQIDANTRFLYAEMPSNPSLGVVDIEALANLAHAHNIPLIIDSTLASPALMRPLCHGADIVIHSVSKIMNSSGMSIAGAVVARHHLVSRVGDDALRENFAQYLKLLPARDFGPSLSPMNAIMILNDLRSLRQRADQMSQTAMTVASWLQGVAAVEAVHYPGLANNAEHDIAKRYMRLVDCDDACERYGYMMGFRVAGGAAATRAFLDKLQMIWRATDLGRVKTVATIPAISTHQQQGEAGRAIADIPDNLVRLSVGLEHPDDIMNDLSQALGV